MNRTFLCYQETRPNLHTTGSHQQGCSQATPIRKAPRHHYRQGDLGDNLLHQRHSRQHTDMSACLHALDHNGIGALALHAPGQLDVRHDRQHLDARGMQLLKIRYRIPCPQRNECGPLFTDYREDLFLIRCHQHYIDPERLIRELPAAPDLRLCIFCSASASGNNPGATGIGYRCRQHRIRNPGHAPLQQWIANS